MKGGSMCDLKTGQKVITPSGRLATVRKVLSGHLRRDAFDRVVCQYDDVENDKKNLVTLQPHLLKKAN